LRLDPLKLDWLVAALLTLILELEVWLGSGAAPERPAAARRHAEGMLAGVLRELDPEGIPMPLLQGGVTDGRFFAQLGIQTYGFMPMRLPPDFPVLKIVHAADERLPVAALEFGTEAVARALQRF